MFIPNSALEAVVTSKHASSFSFQTAPNLVAYSGEAMRGWSGESEGVDLRELVESVLCTHVCVYSTTRCERLHFGSEWHF